MLPPSRSRRIAKWTGLVRLAKWGGMVACVMLVALFVASAWWYVTAWSAGRYYRSFGIGAGVIEVRWAKDPWVGPAMGKWGFSRHRVPMIWTPAVTRGPMSRSTGVHTTIRVPLWLLLLTTATATVLLWRLDRRHLPGHCRQCGYDLRASKKTCPECGTAIA